MNPQTNIHLNTTAIGNKDSFNVINTYSNTYVDEKPQVLEWLSPLEPRVRHHDVRTRRLDGIGEWLLQREEFINWCEGKDESDRAILFCSGDPGVGKTYLSSLVIDELCDRSVGRKVAVACFYCDFQDQKNQTTENILGSLVKQLIRGSGAIPAEIDDAFQKAKGQVGGRGLRVHELFPLLQAALAPLERVFICIDALDECQGKHLPELLNSLHTISQWSPKTRLLITGRPHIDREIKKHFPRGAQFLQIQPTMEDIMKYMQMMLDNDPEPEAMNAELRAEIVERVSESISDVFLLVSLNIAAILAEATIYDRREQLKRMTNGLGLGDAYRVALERMEAQGGAKSKFGNDALMWISRSEQPMTTQELRYALGVRIGSTDLNPESIPSIETVLASCLGLVTVDEAESTVRLVHFTLREYLDSHSEIFKNPYAKMAEVCLTYLNYDCINKIPPTTDCWRPTTPFLRYSSLYWGPYARSETTETVKLLALRLLSNFDSHISAKILLRPHAFELIEPRSRPEGFTGLHCAAYLGIDEIASSLLQIKDEDIHRINFWGRTPLMEAAVNGHEGIIKLFTNQKDIDFETKDAGFGRTALSYAAAGGYHGVVQLLLAQEGVDIESRDDFGRTPLSHAAGSGNEGAVKLLLEREEVNAESKDNSGKTPLSWAAWRGHEAVVKLFLEREEVNADSKDDEGRTPLSHAAGSISEEVVKLFLEREDVNVESKDNGGRTPLSYAAWPGGEGVVKLFLELDDVNADSKDNGGRTPLSRAAGSSSEEVVKLFLEREDVNVESKDNDGRTPLSYAAWCGSEGVIKLFLDLEEVSAESKDNGNTTLLSYAAMSGSVGAVELFLERGEVNAEWKNNHGRTPLSYAAESMNEGVVKLFLEREDVNSESKDNDHITPLSYAAMSGCVEVVKLFLEQEGVNAESKDSDGRTPLSYAARCGYEGVMRLFLEREEVNADSKDNEGRTPLSCAAGSGDEGAVKLLLEREGVDAESKDNEGRTPLSYAAQSRNEAVLELFLERKEVKAESRDNKGRTPLSYAACSGSEGAVNLFLERGEVNAESKDSKGRTPLSYAAESWGERVVTLFLDREEVNIESRDNGGRTPLSYAAGAGVVGTVKLLLEQELVDAESKDNEGRTPLSYAAESWGERVATLFLDREEVNIESRDNGGRTPFSYAAGVGRVGTVKLFLERGGVDAESQDNYGRTPLFYALKYGSRAIGMMLLELREAYPHPPALFEDEVVAQLLQECLDNIPASIKHHSRTPDFSTYKDDRGAESLVQLPLPPPYARVNLRRESAQDSSLVTLSVDEPHQNPRTPTQDPELDLPISHLAHHVPPAVTSIESLASLLHPQPRRILGAPENQSSAISRQNGKLILALHPLLITTMVGLAFLLYLLWCN